MTHPFDGRLPVPVAPEDEDTIELELTAEQMQALSHAASLWQAASLSHGALRSQAASLSQAGSLWQAATVPPSRLAPTPLALADDPTTPLALADDPSLIASPKGKPRRA